MSAFSRNLVRITPERCPLCVGTGVRFPPDYALDGTDEADDDPEGVSEHIGAERHLSPLLDDASALGAQRTDPAFASSGLGPLRRGARSHRFDQLVHRAVQDVQQRHEDLQAQPLRPLYDQAVDLARER